MNNRSIPTNESEQVEFKSSFNSDCIETLVAFANAKGGSVYVGVSDSGTVKGVAVGKESLAQWTNEIKSKTEPSLIPDMDIVEVEGKNVVVIRIIEYPVKPLSFQGRYYKRMGNSNHLMNVAEVSDCYLMTMQYSWDAYTRPDTSLEDLDNQRIEKFLNRINEKGRIYLEGSTMDKLRKLNLIKNDTPTNAAILLFASKPLMYDIHAGRLKTPDMILDDRIIRNTLFEAVEETMRYLIGHLKVAYEISEKTVRQTTQRTEIFEYPLEALRELVLNAIIHRKYNSPVDVQVKIFDNKITIFNPGELYGNLTVEDLLRDDYQASARNRLIVEAFFLTGDIEKYGTGFQRIRKAIAEYPTMKFTYKETQGGFLAELSYEVQKESILNNVEKDGEKDLEKDGEKGAEAEKDLEKDGEKGAEAEKDLEKDGEKRAEAEKDLEKDGEKLNNRQKEILSLIIATPDISAEELANKIGINTRNIEKHIAKLKSRGLLTRIGPDKGGYWKIKQ